VNESGIKKLNSNYRFGLENFSKLSKIDYPEPQGSAYNIKD
jgi:hypothetical protein